MIHLSMMTASRFEVYKNVPSFNNVFYVLSGSSRNPCDRGYRHPDHGN